MNVDAPDQVAERTDRAAGAPIAKRYLTDPFGGKPIGDGFGRRVAIADFAIAAIMLLLAGRSHPGPEIDIAFELRKTALEAIHEDARDLKLTIDAMGQEIRNVKQSVTALVHNPLDVAAEKLLVPAALSILRGMRAKKEHA